ncbi:MAG: hypothetical protein JSV98_01970 [candidate division WOR-3 bacterium]|nr:MAG: hypothetical protein JSV98_01970 [candidate division WOR-3 bacterium]
MRNKNYSVIINFVFGIAFGSVLFRLMLGAAFHYPALYMRHVWYLLYPIQYMRDFTDQSIYILFYVLLCSYILIASVVVYEAPLGRTLLKMLLWMGILAVPFLPFGIEYMSLSRYATSITSYALRLMPFIGLLVWLFLINRYFFKQNTLVSGAWAFAHFLLVIVIITLADLLPMLKTRMFFSALGYRASLANTFLSRMPVVAILVTIALAVFYVFVFDRQFLRTPRKQNRRSNVFTPVFVSIALFLVLMIIRDDFRRYRYFNYQGGIATVYFAAYDDRQMLSFDRNEFSLVSGRQSVFYPFGRFSVRDTLRKHAEDILRMKIIEGLDYYRLARIIAITAYGPRDTMIYKWLRPVIAGRLYRIPEEFSTWAGYLDERYSSTANDMSVSGLVRLNGMPLVGVEYVVNRVSRDEKRAVVPVWHDHTDSNGRFEFSCYKNAREDKVYYQMNFSLPDTMIGKDIGLLKVINVLPVFAAAGEYSLDTLGIEYKRRGSASYRRGLAVQTSSDLDSLLLDLSDVEMGYQAKVAGTVLESGQLEDIRIEYMLPEVDSSTQNSFVEQLGRSRTYLKRAGGEATIIIY